MYAKELSIMLYAAKVAQDKILEIYHKPFDVEIKSDNSPVTLADKSADKIIRDILSKHFPSYGFLTEESTDNLDRLNKEYIFVVDPVDGTKDFVGRDDQFTTNIGLVRNHEVVAGVITIPATNETYFATKNGGAYYMDQEGHIERIFVNDKTSDLTMLISNYHTTDAEREIIEKQKETITKVEGWGSAIKACRIASGKAEVSFRLGNGTKEWDTAASQIIVLEAGGVFAKPDLSEIKYNREDVYNREGFVILNRKENLLIK